MKMLELEKGDVVKVSDSYARNFLTPKKLGIEATKQNLHDLKLQKQAEEKGRKVVRSQTIGKSTRGS